MEEMGSHKRIPRRAVMGSDLGITGVPLAVGGREQTGVGAGVRDTRSEAGRPLRRVMGLGPGWLRAEPRIC